MVSPMGGRKVERDKAQQVLETIANARETCEGARREIASLPGAPQDYWQGLSKETGPIVEAWYRAQQAVDSLDRAYECVRVTAKYANDRRNDEGDRS